MQTPYTHIEYSYRSGINIKSIKNVLLGLILGAVLDGYQGQQILAVRVVNQLRTLSALCGAECNTLSHCESQHNKPVHFKKIISVGDRVLDNKEEDLILMSPGWRDGGRSDSFSHSSQLTETLR